MPKKKQNRSPQIPAPQRTQQQGYTIHNSSQAMGQVQLALSIGDRQRLDTAYKVTRAEIVRLTHELSGWQAVLKVIDDATRVNHENQKIREAAERKRNGQSDEGGSPGEAESTLDEEGDPEEA